MDKFRETAWAPCGLDITGAKTIDEALRMSELDFEVHKKNIFDEHGNAIPNWYRNVRSDNNATLGIVTDKYKIVQNKDAFNFVDNLIDAGVNFEKGGIWKHGTAIWLEAKIPETYKVLGDEVESHIVLINSHDGKGSVKVCSIPNRISCANQLNFALKSATRSWAAVHSTKVDARITEAAETLGLADSYMKALAKEADVLATTRMGDIEFSKIIDRIYPLEEDASNRRITNVTELKTGLMNCLKAPDLADYRNTVWEKALAITDYFDHCNPQRATVGFSDARWQNVATGHREIDKLYKAITESI